MLKTMIPGGKAGMKKILKTVLTIIATTTIATTMSIGTANAAEGNSVSNGVNATTLETGGGKGSAFAPTTTNIKEGQGDWIAQATKYAETNHMDVGSVNKYGNNDPHAKQAGDKYKTGEAGKSNKNITPNIMESFPEKFYRGGSSLTGNPETKTPLGAFDTPSLGCTPPSSKVESESYMSGGTVEVLTMKIKVKEITDIQTGLDPSMSGACSVVRSPAPGGGTFEQTPVGGAYVNITAKDSESSVIAPADKDVPGSATCIYKVSAKSSVSFGQTMRTKTKPIVLRNIKENSPKTIKEKCKKAMPSGNVALKYSFDKFTHLKKAKRVVSESTKASFSKALESFFSKCATDNSIEFPEARSGTATFGQKEPTKELTGGTLSNAPLNGHGGFFNGCLYGSVNRNARMTSYFRAGMKCVVDVKYGPGQTLAGQVWDTAGAKKQTVYKTDYGNNLDSFGLCTKTFDETFPKPGEAELMPTSASGNLLGRYYNHLSWTLDDPDLDITGCKISLDGAPCTPEKIRVAKHNYSYKTAHFMVRQTCSSRANRNGNTMSNIWWRNYNYDNSNIGVETPFGDVHSAKYDMFEGRKLTYTLNDCSTNNTPFGDRFYCAANPNGVGGMDSVASNQVVPRSNVEAPSETDTLAENRLNLENNSAYRKYLGLYSMPSRSGQPLETRWIDEKTGTQSINVTGREAIEQKNNAYINGLSLVRNGLPKSYRWELPIVTSENVNSKMFPVARPSNLRVTGNYVLVRKGGTPFVNTPKSRSIWNINPQGNLTSNQPHYTQNPFLPPEYENGKHKRENGYYDNGRGQIQEYGGASNLDFNLISPKTGQTYDRLVPAGAARQGGNELYHRWNNYHIYKLDTPNANVLMSSKWLSSSGQPLYVAPASEITGQFPVLFAYLQYVSPNASFYSNGFNVTQIQNGKLLCIGPDTIVSSYRANN